MASRALTVAELAEMVGVSTWSIYACLRDTGEIFGVPAYRVRSRWLFPREPFERLFPAASVEVPS